MRDEHDKPTKTVESHAHHFGRKRKNKHVSHGRRHGDRTADVQHLGLYKLAIADLARSGLDKHDFRKLRLEVLDQDQSEDFVGEPRASYKIPYFDLDGSKTAFTRVRFLENRKKKAWHRDTREGSFRYSQPYNSSPHVYFPPYFNWREIAGNPTQKILITEGEKKAAAACKLGIACIALGGVYGFKQGKHFYNLIPELEQVVWKDRVVEICFDADVMMKSEVHQALSQLATELTQKHSPESLEFVFLNAESGAGNKTGLDDYLIAYGVKKFQQIERQSFGPAAKVRLLNSKLCYVSSEQMFFDIQHRKFFRNFQAVREAHMHEGRVMIDAKRTVNIVDMWAENANRRTARSVVYTPGAPETTKDNDFNIWVPSTLQPKKGDCDVWLDLVRHIMRDEECFDWFMKWLAYPVQRPGAKLYQACFVYGEQTGVGKTFVVDPVMELIYGATNFHRLRSTNLTSRFNAYAGHTQFVVSNEVWLPEYKDRTTAMSILKDMITSEQVETEEKFQPKLKFTDHCNYYFTSNHPDALVLEKNDRRFFVVEAPTKQWDREDFKHLEKWVRHGDGASVILNYLQNYDLTGFDPRDRAMQTKWRAQLIQLSQDPLADFVDKIVNDPDMMLMMDGRLPNLQLYRAEDLVRLFELHCPRVRFSPSSTRMGRLMVSAGAERRQVRLTKDNAIRLYSVLDRDKWQDKNSSAWAEHYRDHARIYNGRA